jgi:hypothetical protein
MKIYYRKDDIFIPTWEKNNELPQDDQIKFHHRYLSTAERKKFIYWENYTEGQMLTFSTMNNADKMTQEEQVDALSKNTRRFIQDAEGIARAVTTKIDGLEMVDPAGNVHKIDTIDKFYKAPDAFAALRAEYEAYCLTLSARGDSKN